MLCRFLFTVVACLLLVSTTVFAQGSAAGNIAGGGVSQIQLQSAGVALGARSGVVRFNFASGCVVTWDGAHGRFNLSCSPANTPAVAHKFLSSYNATSGTFSLSQPTADDVSGAASQTGIQQQSYNYAADTGTGNAYAIVLSPAPATYTIGMYVAMKAASTNNGAATLNVNGLGARSIKKQGGTTDLTAGDIRAGQMVRMAYDGTYFQMQSTSGNAPVQQTNTIGCLDGYDHLPCPVYDSGILSSTSLTGVADFDMLSPSPSGVYSVCGTLYISSTTATQGTFQLYLDLFYPGSWYNSGAGSNSAITGTVSANSVGKAMACIPLDVDNDNGSRKLVGQVRASGSPNNSVAYRYRFFVRREH